MIKYVIIDDEPIAHRIIEGYANNLPYLKKVANCYNAFEAMNVLQEQYTDVLFLDINMPKFSGFELLKTLSSPPKVIITSAYKEFAIDGYDFDVTDYLLKPFSFDRFAKAVNKLSIADTVNKTPIEQKSTNQQLFIKADKKIYQINVNDILFIEASGNYCKVFLEDKMIMTLQKISDFEKKLSQQLFMRIHKSFIVAKNKIEVIDGNQIKIQNHSIPVSQTYRNLLNTLFN